MREYYALHPEHLPPPKFYPDFCAREAKQGNPAPLIGYLQSGRALSPSAIEVIVEALEAKRGKRYRDRLRDAEQFLIAQLVENLVCSGWQKEAAIEKAHEVHGRSRRHIFKVIAANKRR